MDRRQFLLAAGASALPFGKAGADTALPVPAGGRMAFSVLRNGSPIGEHHVDFSQSGDVLNIMTSVGLLVTVAEIPVFRYGLRGLERWRGGVFDSFDSIVNFNGDPVRVHAERTAGGYQVQGVNQNNPGKNIGPYLAPPDLLPLTYWNKRMMYGTVLNIQTGHSYPVTVNSPGWNRLPAAGGSVLAQRFDLTGKLRLSVWYDRQDSWSGLEFQKGGDISYQKIMT